MISGVGQPRTGLPTRETWLAALLFTGLTVLLAYPLSLHPSSLRFRTGPDGDLGWYLLGWDTHAFLHKPWSIFEANIYYPQHLTLAYGENVIGIALFAAPVIWVTGNLLLAANVVSMLSSVLCGLGAFVLARRVGLSVAAAVICGIIFECSPPRFYRIGQMPLSNIQWIPFGLAALHGYLDTGRRRDLRIAAGCICLQVLSSGHGAVFMAVSLLIFALYRLLLGEPLRPMTRVRDLGVAGAMLLLPAILVFLPYRAVQHEVGLKRGLGTWGANYGDFLASPSHVHEFLLTAVGKQEVNATAGAFLFPGFLAIALAVAAISWGRRPAGEDREDQPTYSTRFVLTLELALLATATAAGLLTVGALIQLAPSTTPLVDRPYAAAAWIACATVAGLAWAMRRRVPATTFARHRRPLTWLLSAAMVWCVLGIVRSTLYAGDGLAAEYFRSSDWTHPSAFSVVDAEPSTAGMRQRWNGVPPDRFSVQWIGFLTVGRSGLYTFTTTSDDGSLLMVDNRLVVDNDGPHSLAARSGRIRLDRGPHLIMLRYVQFGAEYALDWSWSRDGGRAATVPAWALSQRRARYSTAIAARVVDWALWSFAILTALIAGRYLDVGSRSEAVGRWAAERRRNPTTFYVALVLVALGLALGPPYGLWRYVYWLPGFTFVRANSRFSLIALLGLAVLAGIGFDRISGGVAQRRRTILATLVGLILVAEYAAMPMAVQPSNLEIPAIDRWLNDRPKPFVVAEVPVYRIGDPAFERREAAYMIHSTAHWQKTVHGYSGWRTSLHWQLYSDMQSFPDETSVGSLADLGVTFVVVHTDLYRPDEWSTVEERLWQFSSRLRLEHVDGAGRVYSFVRPNDETAR